MRVVFLVFLVFTSLFAKDELLKKAQEFEDMGNYKEAMSIYKSIALKESEAKDSFLDKKEEFVAKHIPIKDEQTKKSLKQIATSDFGLYPYEKNYFSPFSFSDTKDRDRKKSEAVFQISFKKPVFYNFFGLDESIEFAYTQKSFWQIYKHSLPFRETNYSPELYVSFLHKDSPLKAYKFGFLHNSNGRGGVESRTWNRLYAKAIFMVGDIFLTPTLWYKLHEKGDYKTHEDNPDILKYYGYGDLLITYPYKKHIFELLLRDNLRKKNKGYAKLSWTHPISDALENYFWYVDSSYGYGDSLIDYNRKLFRFTFGVAFSR